MKPVQHLACQSVRRAFSIAIIQHCPHEGDRRADFLNPFRFRFGIESVPVCSEDPLPPLPDHLYLEEICFSDHVSPSSFRAGDGCILTQTQRPAWAVTQFLILVGVLSLGPVGSGGVVLE